MRHAPIDPALFIAHRRQLLELLPKHCIAIVHAADVLPTFCWLTGIEQEESVLVLAPDAADPAQREMLFVRQPTELLCTWEGAKLSKEQAQQLSGIAKVRWVSDLPGVLHTLLCESEVVMLNSNEHERAKMDVEPRDLRLARQLIEHYPLHRYERLAEFTRRRSKSRRWPMSRSSAPT